MIKRATPAAPLSAAIAASTALERADPGAQAVALCLRQAADAQRAAGQRRAEAQQQRLRLLHRAADQLRRAGGYAFWSGVYRAGLAFGAKVAEAAAGAGGGQALKGPLDLAQNIDPLQLARSDTLAARQELAAAAEQRGQTAQHASDRLQSARQLQQASRAQLQRLHGARRDAARGWTGWR